MNYLYGIDLGGTKVEGIVIQLSQPLKIVFRERLPTQREKGYDYILGQLVRMAEMMQKFTGKPALRLGIGTPGDTDPDTGLLRNSNTTVLNDRPLHQDFQNRLGYPVDMANDANCFALAEFHLGAVRKHLPEAKVAFGVIMGTGVGGGLIFDGQLWAGRHGIAGEWGHNYLDDSGGDCYCGRKGCIEAIISGPSLEKYYQQLSGGKHKGLRDIIEEGKTQENGPERKTLDRLIHFYGKALGTVINMIDPEAIVLGGGLGNIDLLYTEGQEEVRKNIFNNRLETSILKPTLGDSAGVFGAVLLSANPEQQQFLRENFQDLTAS